LVEELGHQRRLVECRLVEELGQHTLVEELGHQQRLVECRLVEELEQHTLVEELGRQQRLVECRLVEELEHRELVVQHTLVEVVVVVEHIFVDKLGEQRFCRFLQRR
jgi:hypothetical protein